MVIVVFRTHVKPQADLEKLNALNQKMVLTECICRSSLISGSW